jgi:hypothetical protein
LRPESGLTETKKTSRNPSFPTENLFRIKKSTALALSMQNHAPAQGFPREAPERLRGADQASIWAIKQTGHRVKCPACDCDALLSGAPIDAPIRTIDGDEITEVQQKLPSRFECIACGLKISGLPQLAACGLGDAYKTTSIYDAAEYYAPDDDYSGFEPDNNEP